MEAANDPVYLTYYMMDWKKVPEVLSEDRCITCGKPMFRVEPITTVKGIVYEGLVCHDCKCLYWIKKD